MEEYENQYYEEYSIKTTKMMKNNSHISDKL